MPETLLQRAQRLGIKPANPPKPINALAPVTTGTDSVAPPGETLLQKAQRLGIKPVNPPVQQPQTTPTTVAQPEKSWYERTKEKVQNINKIVPDFLQGQAIGADTTALNLGELGSKAMEAGYNATIGKLTGKKAFSGSNFAEPFKQAIAPINAAQKAGFASEQIGEFFIPMGAVAETAKTAEAATLATKLPKIVRAGMNLAGRAALEGGAAAGVTAAQGGDTQAVKENALLGAGGSVASKALEVIGSKLAPVLKTSAEKGYAQALAPTTKANKEITKRIVPQLIDKKITAFTRGSLMNKFSKSVENSGQAMDKVLETIPKDSPVNLSNVVNDLERAKQNFMVPGANGKMVIVEPQAVQHIEGFQNIIRNIGETNAPYESVRKLRQIWDKSVANSGAYYGKTLAEGSLMDAKKETVNAIRTELAKEFSDMDKANKEFSFWSKAQKVLGDTIERTQSQQKPFRETVKRAAGAVIGASVGGPGGAVVGDVAMSGLSKLVDSTAWKTVGAIQKMKIANLMASGKFKEVINLITKIAEAQNAKNR